MTPKTTASPLPELIELFSGSIFITQYLPDDLSCRNPGGIPPDFRRKKCPEEGGSIFDELSRDKDQQTAFKPKPFFQSSSLLVERIVTG